MMHPGASLLVAGRFERIAEDRLRTKIDASDGARFRESTDQTTLRWLDRDGERVMTEVAAGEHSQLDLLLQAAA